ncbi:MAG: ankyrin repeat domain-containing protein [Alphaproteobacteria bacterium]|nr:ankyrin repeat domain-containing protein [Alphaproteobacteria bacterium]
MTIRALHSLALALALSAVAPAQAGMIVYDEAPCPLDPAEKVRFESLTSYSRQGMRLDGRPIDSKPRYLALSLCSKSGLVVYKREFSADEVARLRPLVASPEYQRLRHAELPHYLRYWLVARMEPGAPEAAIDMILEAIWVAEDVGRPEKRTAYAREARALIDKRAKEVKAARVRAIYALIAADLSRSLGEPAEALRRLAAIKVPDGEDADYLRRWAEQIKQSAEDGDTAPVRFARGMTRREILAALDRALAGQVPLDAPKLDGLAPLHVAVAYGRHDALKTLLDMGANVETRAPGFRGQTPLQAASQFGDVASVRMLLARGARHDAKSEDLFGGDPALTLAASAGHAEIVALLLDAGADPNAKGAFGKVALDAVRDYARINAGNLAFGAVDDQEIAGRRMRARQLAAIEAMLVARGAQATERRAPSGTPGATAPRATAPTAAAPKAAAPPARARATPGPESIESRP